MSCGTVGDWYLQHLARCIGIPGEDLITDISTKHLGGDFAAIAHQVAFSIPRPIDLIIIRGLPGSGKSTAARQFENHLHYEPDHLFCDTQGRYKFDLQLWDQAQRFVFQLADFALARREQVVVTDVFPRLDQIAPYADLAKQHGASFGVITCTEQFGNVHNVPITVVEQMRSQFEPLPEDHPWNAPL